MLSKPPTYSPSVQSDDKAVVVRCAGIGIEEEAPSGLLAEGQPCLLSGESATDSLISACACLEIEISSTSS